MFSTGPMAALTATSRKRDDGMAGVDGKEEKA